MERSGHSNNDLHGYYSNIFCISDRECRSLYSDDTKCNTGLYHNGDISSCNPNAAGVGREQRNRR
jgi:hypothetical protein